VVFVSQFIAIVRSLVFPLLTVITSLNSPAANAELILSGESTFSYEFYGSDIFPWVDGSKSGPVLEDKGVMASVLEAEMDQVDSYIEFAIYGVNKQDWLINVINSSVQYGVLVRGVVDQTGGEFGEWIPENFMYADTTRLPLVMDADHIFPDVSPSGRPRAGSIMHNKFFVMDRKKIWIGSTNLSHTGIGSEYNANNSVLIDSPSLAPFFSEEFEQMFTDRKFSRYKLKSPNTKSVLYGDGTVVSVYFSPQDNTLEEAILPFIGQSERTLDLAMFFLTDDRVAAAIADAVERGVKVRLLYDASAGAHSSTMHHWLRANSVEVRVENWGGKMHMKTAISDDSNVLFGSMNWSRSGDTMNDESTLLVQGNREFAVNFTNYYNRLWSSLDSIYSGVWRRDPTAEGPSSINSCEDGIDNDHDGKIDLEEQSCN
jgi:phosphatidylserine/phosphatidylglycerophosphate/cardiolipin synthase-like enzyme